MISEFSPLGDPKYIGFKTKNRKSRKIFIFWIYKVLMNGSLLFYHYFNFLSAKPKINKNVLNLINLDGLEAFKRQKYDT